MTAERQRKQTKKGSVTLDTVREIACALPGVREGTSWGSPSFKINGKLVLCMAVHRSSEPNSLIVGNIEFEERDEMVAEDPGVFYFTPHYAGYPCVLVRLEKVSLPTLRALIQTAWRRASKQKR